MKNMKNTDTKTKEAKEQWNKLTSDMIKKIRYQEQEFIGLPKPKQLQKTTSNTNSVSHMTPQLRMQLAQKDAKKVIKDVISHNEYDDSEKP